MNLTYVFILFQILAIIIAWLGTIIAEIAGKNNEKKKQEKTNSRFKI